MMLLTNSRTVVGVMGVAGNPINRRSPANFTDWENFFTATASPVEDREK
jgi:hypothetical protein